MLYSLICVIDKHNIKRNVALLRMLYAKFTTLNFPCSHFQEIHIRCKVSGLSALNTPVMQNKCLLNA